MLEIELILEYFLHFFLRFTLLPVTMLHES